MDEYIEKIRAYFQANPNGFGLVLVAVGLLLLVGAILRWQWVLEIKPTVFLRILHQKYGRKIFSGLCQHYSLAINYYRHCLVFCFLKYNTALIYVGFVLCQLF
ncbi:MAG: hypothetical protein EOO91_10245 [Pedobacter sp.]|nr:MAG: hypothetical protein EOO91_10245 [Pedobacter sp.]